MRKMPIMKGSDFGGAIGFLGMSQAQFARHIDVEASTVSRWKTRGGIPHVVQLYVELLVAARKLSTPAH